MTREVSHRVAEVSCQVHAVMNGSFVVSGPRFPVDRPLFTGSCQGLATAYHGTDHGPTAIRKRISRHERDGVAGAVASGDVHQSRLASVVKRLQSENGRQGQDAAPGLARLSAREVAAVWTAEAGSVARDGKQAPAAMRSSDKHAASPRSAFRLD